MCAPVDQAVRSDIPTDCPKQSVHPLGLRVEKDWEWDPLPVGRENSKSDKKGKKLIMLYKKDS